jgi:hypothetical protein
MYVLYNLRFRCFDMVRTKEDIKEQPTPRNLSASAARVLQCTCPIAASRKDCSAIPNSPHLRQTRLGQWGVLK